MTVAHARSNAAVERLGWMSRGRVANVLPLLLLGGAIVVGALLRFSGLGEAPPGLNQDEAVNGYDAYSLLLTGRDHLGHPFPFAGLESFGDWVSPLLTFVTVPAVAAFGLRVETLRGVTALFGTLAVPALYLLTMELFGRRWLAVTAAWCLALLPWAVHLGRWAIPPATVPLLVTLVPLALLRLPRRFGDRGFTIAIGLAAVAVSGYPTLKLAIPTLVVAALLVYWRRGTVPSAGTLFTAGLLALALAGPAYYLSLRDPGGRARFVQVSALGTPDGGIGLLARNYLAYFSPDFLLVSGDGDPMHLPAGTGALPVTYALLALAGLAWLGWLLVRPGRPEDRRGAALVLLLLLLYPVPGSLTLPAPHALRGAQGIPLAALLAACGLYALVLAAALVTRSAPPLLRALAPATVTGLVATTLAAGALRWYAGYRATYPARVEAAFQTGYLEAARYATARAAEYDEIWLSDASAAYIYLLFAGPADPDSVHSSLVVRRAPPRFNRAEKFGKYAFGQPDYLRKQDLPVLAVFAYPDGRAAYAARGGTIAGHGRVLFIGKP